MKELEKAVLDIIVFHVVALDIKNLKQGSIKIMDYLNPKERSLRNIEARKNQNVRKQEAKNLELKYRKIADKLKNTKSPNLKELLINEMIELLDTIEVFQNG